MGNWRYKRNVVSTINESFDQPSFIAYNKNLESVLANFVNDDQISSQIKFVKENVAEDIKFYYLLPLLEIFKVLMNEDILNEVKSPALNNQRAMIAAVIKICKLNLHACQSSHCSNRRKIVKFLWYAESKPGCDQRWPSRDLTMLQSSYTHWRQELMLCDLLMWLKNPSVKVKTTNITLEHFLMLTSFI